MSRGDQEIAQRLVDVKSRIRAACDRCGRCASEVTLVAVSKKQPVELLQLAVNAGQAVFGESQVQEAERKAAVLLGVEWHMIGPLQSNKARRAARLFDVIHSVDRIKVAKLLNREASALGRRLDVFIQLNLGAESSKHGFAPQDLNKALGLLAGLEALRIIGLMAIPPMSSRPEQARAWFRELREHRDRAAAHLGWGSGMGKLSMGMSRDFEEAIEEGATHIRVGTEIFGQRPPAAAR